jgi:hypothetical protein
MPPIPSGLYSASETAALTSSDQTASCVGSHGRWSEKKLRVSSSVMPENGSENANQNSASLTWRVDSASKSPRS